MKNKGFTLIELLVVVLIIGILAAIAVPQYQKAVIKSEASQVISLVRAIGNAEEIYYLANGNYVDSFESLDVSLPNGLTNCSYQNFPCKQYGNFKIYLYHDVGIVDAISAKYYVNGNPYFQIGYYLYKQREVSEIRENSGNLTCIAETGSNRQKGIEICQSLGGTLIDDSDGRYFRL